MKTLGAGDRKPRDYYFATNLSNRAVDKGIHATKNGEEKNKNMYPTKKMTAASIYI
jgi:hypothetical protein